MKKKYQKLKARFKRALFAFFKDEILNSLKYKDPIHNVTIISKTLEFKELKREILFDMGRFNDMMNYEEELLKAKEQLFYQCLDFIHVDSQELISPKFVNRRSVMLKLYVGIR